MTTDEKTLAKRFGKENSFTVPEGYFDTLTERVMSNIDTKQPKIIHITPMRNYHWKEWSCAVAACIAGAIICVNIFNSPTQVDNSNLMGSNITTEQMGGYDEEFKQEVLNYAMVDYNDVYTYMSGANY